MTPTTLDYSNAIVSVNQQHVEQIKSKTRFIGKHSRDSKISIFLHQRNINSHQKDGTVDEILGLVRINQEALHSISKGVIVVGVMARLLCDHGLQFSEHFLYQREAQIYPNGVGSDEIELVTGTLGDSILPDDLHRGFKIKLPAELPPSSIFLSPDTSMGPGLTGDSPWGLTYYLYAYMTHNSTGSYDRLRSSSAHFYNVKKGSKVFLSFTRSMRSDPQSIIQRETPPTSTVTKTIIPSNKSVRLTAALDRSFFYMNDLMAVQVHINNPRNANITGVRITLKQVITMRALNQTKQILKVPLAVYEFHKLDSNGKFIENFRADSQTGLELKSFPFIIDTLRIKLTTGQNLQQVAVESRLPRNSIKQLLLCPSFQQVYEMQDNPMKYFAIEYYMNVHVIVPWGSNLIAKLPFTVTSHGANSTSGPDERSIDNLAVLTNKFGSMGLKDDKDDADEELLNAQRQVQDRLRNDLHSKPSVNVIPPSRLAADTERAIKLFEYKRSQMNSLDKYQSLPKAKPNRFEVDRRIWVREFLSPASEILEKLNILTAIIFEGSEITLKDSSAALDFIEILFSSFLPQYHKLISCHTVKAHIDTISDALGRFLDTTELFLMKMHLNFINEMNRSKNSDYECDDKEVATTDLVDIVNERLFTEFIKLILVIPGLVEWRWFIESIQEISNGCESTDDSSNLDECTVTEMNMKLAKIFLKIHQRLTESFSEAPETTTVTSDDLIEYGKILFTLKKGDRRCMKIQLKYFRLALFIYYGAYPKLLLPNEDQVDANEDHKLNLREMRSKLEEYRVELIDAMRRT